MNSLSGADCGSTRLTNNICINQLKSARNTPQEEQKTYPDLRFYISFSFFMYDQKMFTVNSENPFFSKYRKYTLFKLILVI